MSAPMKRLLDLDGRRAPLDRVVELAHCHLGLDAVVLAELTTSGHLRRAAAGDVSSFTTAPRGDHTCAEAEYCRRLVDGEIPNLIHDASADGRVAELAATQQARIGSFIGVAVQLSDGTPYGALYGISHAADRTLDARDVRFMSMLGELIVDDLDEQRSAERLHADIMRLIDSASVDVAYQPILGVDGRCLGIEALARFPNPFGPPDVTLAAARTVGLGLELERLAIREAWKIIPALGPGQFLALNVSPDALLELARRANLRVDLPLPQLVVEITEHTAVESYGALHAQLAPLREHGLRIAVDDAGAGFASLRHVLELRPDFIKVDRSLIHGIADDHARRVAVSAFLSLALDLGSIVVAEGVERASDLSAVTELGLQAVQGFLLAKPTTSRAALSRWIGSGARAQPQKPAAARSARRRSRSAGASPGSPPKTPATRP
jgi:EAL domain-containing protein (putative c-di-GMP-specific phosphodiesterase class I)